MAKSIPTKNLFGRTVLYTNETEITEDNLLDVLSSVLPTFAKNKAEIDFLYRYYRGDQPILRRQKKHRPEIKNMVVENHAHEIVSFKTAYDFGEPIQYIRRATKSGTESRDGKLPTEADDMEITSKITLVNEYMFTQNKATQDTALAEWFFICGTAYRMVLPTGNEADAALCPFEFDTLDPRYTAVVYNRGFRKRPVMSFQEVEQSDGSLLYCVYTPTQYFEVKMGNTSTYSAQADNVIVKSKGHLVGYIPVVEYAANSARLGAFELVMSLLDEINNVESNRIDSVEQFVQAFMKFINVQIDEEQFEALKELGAISFHSDPNCPADIGIVTAELNQQQVQTIVDHLYQMVLIICGMPDRNGANRTTGDTGQAVILRDGWTAAEAKSKETEAMFKKAETQFLRIVLKIIQDQTGIAIRLSDIDIKFIPNKTDNLLTKTQAMQNMLEAGIHPQRAIAKSGLFGDPEQVYIDSIPYIRNKWKTKAESDADSATGSENAAKEEQVDVTPANNKPNPTEG